MDKTVEQQLAALETVVAALPNYLTRNELYTDVPRQGEGRLTQPVSIGIALDLVQKLRRRDLSPEITAKVEGLEGRIRALERIYPNEYKRKLASEERSRGFVARQAAEED